MPSKEKKEAKKSADNSAVLAKARERAREGATYWGDNWEQAEEDLKFLSGDQWPETVRTERENDGRPCLTNNVLPTFVEQIIGDQLQNKPSIKISSVDVTRVKNAQTGEDESLKISSVAGSQDYELAEVLQGIIKNIEYNCDAEDAYDVAFQSIVESGIGYLRVRSDYLSDDTFQQDLIIEAIENQFSVIVDPMAKKIDKSDAMWIIIDDEMLKEEFEDQYPDATADSSGSGSSGLDDWFDDNTVRVSEYFTREPVTKEMVLLSDGRSMYMDDVKPVLDELEAKGITVARTRKVKTFKTMWRKITGLDVLEGPIEIKCSTIPVVPVYGKSTTIKKKKIYRSAIRHSKDAQRMANYWDSAATESVALAPKAPFIGSEGHVEGRESEWENANKTNSSLLTYTPQYQNDPGPRREQTAQTPAAEITLGMQSSDKIKSTLGLFDASVGAASNETSGKAIIARERQGNKGSFRYIDNLSKAIRRVGRICIELIPTTYDDERIVRMKFEDGTEDFVKLNEQIFDEDTKEWVTINDISVGKYDVIVTTGPAYATQRMEAAETMIQFAKAVPNAAGVMGDLIALNMDWPGADMIAERLKKIVPPNILSRDDREELAKDQPEQQEPTPEQQLQMKELETKGKEIEADSLKAQAGIAQAQTDLVKAQLQSEEAKAKLQEIQNGKGDAYAQVRELVAQALAELSGSQMPTA